MPSTARSSPSPSPDSETSSSVAPNFTLADADITTMPKPFRNPAYKHPARRIKNLKQLVSDEQKRIDQLFEAQRARDRGEDKAGAHGAVPGAGKNLFDLPNYMSVEAPPSVMPRKWYCDVTGLAGNYRMPGNGMRYYNKEVYDVIRHLPAGVDQQYLQIRSANIVLK
ncbi:uncharacterized protein V1510DRAFT_369945 [Dipodascopsis tothii]|uniref:uncharacterized protein n=1 Tax=Dipodascopsis tothii TaxID=44089 RepID=UPI0034D01794